MNFLIRALFRWLALLCCVTSVVSPAVAQEAAPAVEPVFGQPGKDVVWVPTAEFVVEKMLDVAQVTARDYVIDLGSGDGRNLIAAARRGARALGVEYDANLVAVSRQAAAEAGVADRVQFVQGDFYEADISQATVLALYLLPEIMRKLAPRFLALRPGTRIVSNTFGIEGWRPDATEKGPGECTSFCTVLLYIVPAKVAGTWRMPQGDLTFTQSFQMVSGTLNSGGASVPVTGGRLLGDRITFSVAGVTYSGRVNGDTMSGEMSGGGAAAAWSATRVQP